MFLWRSSIKIISRIMYEAAAAAAAAGSERWAGGGGLAG